MFTHAQRTATADVAKALPWFWSGPLLRPWHRHWGATPDEVGSAMPGDDLLLHAHFEATRAISIAAPPDRVWPWIVQIGFRRAGFYSYDLLDNLGHPSASEIVPEFQKTAIGDRVAMAEPATDVTSFRVEAFERDRWLLWHKPDSTWAWRFDALPGGGTRLVTRLRARYDLDRPFTALGSMFLMEFGDFPMMRRLLQTVRSRAEDEAVRDGRTVALPADGTAISHWADPDAKVAYDAAYDALDGPLADPIRASRRGRSVRPDACRRLGEPDRHARRAHPCRLPLGHAVVPAGGGPGCGPSPLRHRHHGRHRPLDPGRPDPLARGGPRPGWRRSCVGSVSNGRPSSARRSGGSRRRTSRPTDRTSFRRWHSWRRRPRSGRSGPSRTR